MARVVPVSSPSSVADLVPFKVMFWARWKFPWQVPVITRMEPGGARSILAWRSCREQFTWMVLTADALGAVMRSPAMRTAANGIKDSRLPIPCVFTRVLPPQIAGECPNGPAGLVSMAYRSLSTPSENRSTSAGESLPGGSSTTNAVVLLNLWFSHPAALPG